MELSRSGARPSSWLEGRSGILFFVRLLARSERGAVRAFVVALGLCWSIAFAIAALRNHLQLYADGAMFSYAVGAEDVWAFHWRNIAGRMSVWLLAMAPAEIGVALTRDPDVGVLVYGLIFYLAPLAGLIATFLLDRSRGRAFFLYACLSTAVLCPLVFGFPTEMWMAHALFWPALTASHYAPRTGFGTAAVIVALLALAFTHEGALVLVAAIVATLAPRGPRDRVFLRAAIGLAVVFVAEVAVRLALPPDDYFAAALSRAALHFFDPTIFQTSIVRILLVALGGYAALSLTLARLRAPRPYLYAALAVIVALAAYWAWFDHALHAANRYYLRTALVVVPPALGALAACEAGLAEDGGRFVSIRGWAVAAPEPWAWPVAAAISLVTLVHVVETAKFLAGWKDYRAAVVALAVGGGGDGADFVSSDRIAPDLNRLAWASTTPYLAATLAHFEPNQLVVEPDGGYFWLTCDTARDNERADRAIPPRTRELVRIYACLHR